LRERIVAGDLAVRVRDLPSPRNTELLPQDVAMRLRRPWRDAEALSNLFVRAAGRDQLDLLLSRVKTGGLSFSIVDMAPTLTTASSFGY